MAWNERGNDRGKRYAVYQQLEAHYHAAIEALHNAKDEIERKDALIRALAAELASLRTPQEEPKEASGAPQAPTETIQPPDLKSSPYMHYPPVRPGLAKAQLKGRTITERLEELQGIMAATVPEIPKEPKGKG
jgi:hypothetical protein